MSVRDCVWQGPSLLPSLQVQPPHITMAAAYTASVAYSDSDEDDDDADTSTIPIFAMDESTPVDVDA